MRRWINRDEVKGDQRSMCLPAYVQGIFLMIKAHARRQGYSSARSSVKESVRTLPSLSGRRQ